MQVWSDATLGPRMMEFGLRILVCNRLSPGSRCEAVLRHGTSALLS